VSDFKAKMHQIRLWLSSAPDPAGGAYSTAPDLLAGFKGPTSKGREGREGEGEREGERKGRKKKGKMAISRNSPRWLFYTLY